MHLVKNYLWILIIVFALCVRFWKIEYMPYVYDADELSDIWAGQSLIQYGVPISWSSFEHDDTQWQWVELANTPVANEGNLRMQFLRPWFDHSFVIPLIVGGWSLLLGYSFPNVPPNILYRLPLLVIAGLNMGLVYAITRRIFGKWSGLFALTLIAGSPIMIFAQRMSVSENIASFGMLLAIYFYITKQPLWSIILATVLAGWSKLTVMSIFPVIGVALLAEKKYRQAIMYGLGVFALLIAGYAVYGSVDMGIFLETMKGQSSRLLGWSNPAFILAHPGFHHKDILDFSYYLFLFFGLTIFFIPQRRETKILAGSMITAWLTIWASSAEQDNLGWYKLPFFLMLAVCSGAVIELLSVRKETTEEKQSSSQSVWIFVLVLMGIAVFNNFGIVRFPTDPLPEAQFLRVIIAGVMASSVFGLYYVWKRQLYGGALAVLMIVYMLQSFHVADQYFAGLCRDRNCPTPTITLSRMVKSALGRP